MPPLWIARPGPCTPERFARLARGLLEREVGDPVLLLAPLVGEAILLGRHQRAASALRLDQVRARGLAVVRRVGGGRTLWLGDGAFGLFAAVPPGASLHPGRFGADKVMNRYVRGLLTGLRRSGARAAAWLGRDFVSSDTRRVAVVSQEGSPAGATAFEAVVALGADLSLPPELTGYPPHPDPRAAGPAPASLAQLAGGPVGVGALEEALVQGYAAASGLAPAPLPGPLPEGEPLEGLEPEEGLSASGPTPVAIGFAEALVRRAGPAIVEARLRGDFIAPAFALRALERSLAGSPLAFEEVGRRVDAAFRAPGAFLVGVPRLSSLAEAILAAGTGPLAAS